MDSEADRSVDLRRRDDFVGEIAEYCSWWRMVVGMRLYTGTRVLELYKVNQLHSRTIVILNRGRGFASSLHPS